VKVFLPHHPKGPGESLPSAGTSLLPIEFNSSKFPGRSHRDSSGNSQLRERLLLAALVTLTTDWIEHDGCIDTHIFGLSLVARPCGYEQLVCCSIG
jgi:hypothetical protein